MDFGAEIADRSYQEIPTGALRPRHDMLESASEQNDKLKFSCRSNVCLYFFFSFVYVDSIQILGGRNYESPFSRN